ncbi:MAG: carbon-nitrogen hydrolase family protein [Pseudomonadota bacterium]|nr:carbon-nitrogen hydrolase family protein [Pseudomonadota bacterium]
MNPTLNVVVLQMTSGDIVEKNIEQALSVLGQPSLNKVDLISLPENCLFLRVEGEDKVKGWDATSPYFEPFKDFAKKNNLFIHLGSIPLNRNSQIYNSSIIIEPTGNLVADYSKIHLFDVDVDGERSHRESMTFAHGELPTVVDIRGWKVGLTICYDLRFSELFLHYAKQPVDLILVPAAFTVPTGQAHWEILLRARAIEAQCYVAAAAQSGTHVGHKGGKRQTYGHSVIIDPWGTKLVEAHEGLGIIKAGLEKSEIEKVRRQIPMKNHRRL